MTINAFCKHKRYKFTNFSFFSRSTAYLKYNDQTTPYQNSLLDPAFAIGYRTNCVISSRCYRISLNIFKRFVSVMNLLVRVLKNKTIFVDTKLLLCFFSNRLYSWSEFLPHTKIKQSWMLNLNINGGCWRRLKVFWASYFFGSRSSIMAKLLSLVINLDGAGC